MASPPGTHEACIYLPKVLALAATEQADHESDDENRTEHRQRDYQYLEVHCKKKKNLNVTNL